MLLYVIIGIACAVAIGCGLYVEKNSKRKTKSNC